ncbi:MAG: hypothetical protein RMY64_25960 [Nostoc sp. DedQUE08]|nr:hypothetical protein [Nostoc sp. DedQUE08]MDZ8069017.1 hypothetical protein [Nostoc sp. DedQUE08]
MLTQANDDGFAGHPEVVIIGYWGWGMGAIAQSHSRRRGNA